MLQDGDALNVVMSGDDHAGAMATISRPDHRTVSPFGKARKVLAVAMLVAGSGVRHAAEEGAICLHLAVARAT
jgi:hypothetical protein